MSGYPRLFQRRLSTLLQTEIPSHRCDLRSMVHYIRFLSPPKVVEAGKKNLNVSAVLAVTTDLGDAFYPEDVELRCRVVGVEADRQILHEEPLTWTHQSRALKLVLNCPGKYASQSVRLHVYALELDSSILVPKILDVWSLPFYLTDKQRAEPLVDREFLLSSGSKLKIREETGDSIARHIWDASLGFLLFLERALRSTAADNSIAKLLIKAKSKRLRVIELGAGCGIVGLAFAQLLKCDIVLTDLDDAIEILNTNSGLATAISGTKTRVEVLDWSSDLPDSLNAKYDLVLVSDCVYNPESSVHLVETLTRLTRLAANTVTLVGYKRRHQADDVFFDSMKTAGFEVLQSSTITLPHTGSVYDASAPSIEFYIYQTPS